MADFYARFLSLFSSTAMRGECVSVRRVITFVNVRAPIQHAGSGATFRRVYLLVNVCHIKRVYTIVLCVLHVRPLPDEA